MTKWGRRGKAEKEVRFGCRERGEEMRKGRKEGRDGWGEKKYMIQTIV